MAEKTRNNGIELWNNIPVYSGIYYASHGLMALCRVAVDIFVLITGMFMVRKKFASRRIFSVMLMTWFYALAQFFAVQNKSVAACGNNGEAAAYRFVEIHIHKVIVCE